MKIVRWIITVVLLAGGIVLCALRWQAWFGMPAEPQWTADTLAYRFSCFGDKQVKGFVSTPDGWLDTQDPTNLKFVLFGDVHNSLTRAELDTIYARHEQIDMYAQLGDFMERPYFYYQQALFAVLDSSQFKNLPILATPGNHEYNKGLVPYLGYWWYGLFRNPFNGPHDFRGASYYVDFPKLRFIAIDTQGLLRVRDYTRVVTWLNKTIKEAGDRFVVVMMHHPVYSCGAGRQNYPLRWFLRSALNEADLVFAGHDHNYARRMPFVNTNSAQKFYLPKVSKRDERIGSNRRFYEVVSITGKTLLMQTYILETGELYDEVCLIKHEDRTEIIDRSSGIPEIIELPARYEHKNSLSVKRFLYRQAKRLQETNEQVMLE